MKSHAIHLVILCLLFSSVLFSQDITSDSGLHFPGVHNYRKAKIYLDDENNSLIEATRLIIDEDNLKITPKRSYTSNTDDQIYHLDDTFLIKVSTGTKAAEYALIGGLSTGLGALLGVADASSDPNTEIDESKATTVVVALTAIGAVIGGIWGSTVHKWDTIYLKDQIGSSDDIKLNYYLSFDNQSNGVLLNFALCK